MKYVASAVFFVVFGIAATALAETSEFQVSKTELEQLEQALEESRLEHEPLTDEDFDDDDDNDDDELASRIWNPVTWVKNKLKNKCACENNQCDCCFKLKLFKSKACFTAAPLMAEKQVEITFKLGDKTLVDRRFSLEREDSVCGSVPVPGLSFVKFCFDHDSTVQENGALTSCSSVDFRVGSTTGAILQFQCLELNDGKITMGGYEELKKSAIFSLKCKNPFKAAVKLYRKIAGKN